MKWIGITGFILAVIIRIVYFGQPEDFYSDAAIRFRYVKMYSEGESIPDVDKKLHHPDGLKVTNLIHPTMDWVIGNSHRLIKNFVKIDLITYIKYFVSIFSAFSVFAVFLLGRLFTKKKESIILITVLYAVGIAGYWRILGNYLREEFVLPFYLFALYFFLRSFIEKKYAFVSGCCFALTLISWHLSQFIFTIFLVYVTLVYIFYADKREITFQILYRILIPVIIVAIIWPTLTVKFFILSIPMLVGFILIVLHLIATKLRIKFEYLIPIFLIAPLPLILSGQVGQYSHVFQLVLIKIRLLGTKPVDPNLVPVDARMIWTGPFSSPGIYSMLVAFGLTIILSLVSIPTLMKDKKNILNIFILYLLVVYAISYLLIIRLEIFLFPFVVLAIGMLFEKQKKILFSALIIILLIPELIKTACYPAVYQRYFPKLTKEWEVRSGAIGNEFNQVMRWFAENSEKSEAILAYVDLSAMLLARNGNPIAIQPIYEMKSARDRVREFVGLLYQPEAILSSNLRKNGIKYVLYQKDFLFDNTPSSIRYILAIDKINKNSSVYKMHFYPDSLKDLKLQYQTLSFRIYELDGEKIISPRNYSPYFDPRNFDLTGYYFTEEEKAKQLEQYVINLVVQYNNATELLKQKKYSAVIPIFLAVRKRLPRFQKTDLYLAMAYQQLGDNKNALESIKRGLSWDTAETEYFRILGNIAGRYPPEKGIAMFGDYVAAVDRSAVAHLWFGYFLAAKNRFKRAQEEFLKAKDIDPDNPDIDKALMKINQDLTGPRRENIIPK